MKIYKQPHDKIDEVYHNRVIIGRRRGEEAGGGGEGAAAGGRAPTSAMTRAVTTKSDCDLWGLFAPSPHPRAHVTPQW